MAHGHRPVRRGLRVAVVHAGADDGELPDLLRHRLSRHRAAVRPAAADVAGLCLACRARCGASARRPAGSGSTTTRPTRTRRSRACGPTAGPDATGRRRPRSSTVPRARRPGCSTRPRSPRSRSAGRDAARFLERVCDNGSRARSTRSPTPRRSTRAAASRPTSPSPGSPTTVPGRHRDGVRHPRPRLAAQAGPARGVRRHPRRTSTESLRDVRPLGTGRARHPRPAHAMRTSRTRRSRS